MKNLKTIQQLSEQLEQLLTEEFNNLQSMELIPDNLTDDDDKYYDWLYELPVLYKANKYNTLNGFRIAKVIRKENRVEFEGIGIDDDCDIEEFFSFDFTIDDKIQLLQCVNDVIKANATTSQP